MIGFFFVFDRKVNHFTARAKLRLAYIIPPKHKRASAGIDIFSNCSKLENVTINAGEIGRLFQSITTIKSVTLGDSVTSIGDNAFIGCSGLTSVEIPDSVTSIGNSAFSYCSGLTSVTIGDGVELIGYGAFRDCSGLESVVFGESVTSIGDSAFYGCSGLESITIPNSVTSIGDSAFSGCSVLTSIVIDEGNAKYTDGECNAIIDKSTKTLIQGFNSTDFSKIPNSVTSIGNSAFNRCSGLESITIPNSVTSIGDFAFNGCSGLTSVTIGDGVELIGNGAFSGCSALTDIYYAGSQNEWNALGGSTKVGISDRLNTGTLTIHYNSTGPSEE